MQVSIIHVESGASVSFAGVTNCREQVVGGVNVWTITWAGQTIRIPTAGFSSIITTFSGAST